MPVSLRSVSFLFRDRLSLLPQSCVPGAITDLGLLWVHSLLTEKRRSGRASDDRSGQLTGHSDLTETRNGQRDLGSLKMGFCPQWSAVSTHRSAEQWGIHHHYSDREVRIAFGTGAVGWDNINYGTLLVVFIIFPPQGLVGTLQAKSPPTCGLAFFSGQISIREPSANIRLGRIRKNAVASCAFRCVAMNNCDRCHDEEEDAPHSEIEATSSVGLGISMERPAQPTRQ